MTVSRLLSWGTDHEFSAQVTVRDVFGIDFATLATMLEMPLVDGTTEMPS
jgi:hypothetical protein